MEEDPPGHPHASLGGGPLIGVGVDAVRLPGARRGPRGEPRGRATRAARTGGHEPHDEPGHPCRGRNGGSCSTKQLEESLKDIKQAIVDLATGIKECKDRITALEDNSLGHCVYAHRTPQAEVVQEYTGWGPSYV